MVWPIGGLLADAGLSQELLLPGQDSPSTIISIDGGSSPGTATAGVRFLTSGLLQSNVDNVFATILPDSWIHSDSQGIVDASLYEARYTSVTGDTAEMSGNSLDDWHQISSIIEFSISAGGGPSDFVIHSVSGILQVREVANTANIRSGTLNLTARWEGNF